MKMLLVNIRCGLILVIFTIMIVVIFQSCSLKDGYTCNSTSIAASRMNKLLVGTYSVVDMSPLIDSLVREVWIEKQCVYKGSTPTAIPGLLLFLRLDVHVEGGPEFVHKYGVWKIEQAKRHFDLVGENLETYFPSLPLDDTLKVVIRSGYRDEPVRVMDSFFLVRNYFVKK